MESKINNDINRELWKMLYIMFSQIYGEAERIKKHNKRISRREFFNKLDEFRRPTVDRTVIKIIDLFKKENEK